MLREIPETKRKALRINLEPTIYGTFAEIGAGQEVARNFFTAGAASGTIAKTMSAYDMVFSNEIYGIESSGRYVSKSRLARMLSHEYDLLTERLGPKQAHSKRFFAFANTVTTLNYTRTNDPHGWVGLKFQADHEAEANEIILHVRLLDSDTSIQQDVLGILGVNLVYAAYFLSGDLQTMIESLVDNLSPGSLIIDTIHVKGPEFKEANDRLVNLYLVAKGFSSAAIFDKNGHAMQVKDLLYKKDIMILRTKFRQKSNPNFSLFNRAVEQFKKVQQIDDKNLIVIIEVLMTNLLDSDKKINREDLLEFAKRAEDLCATGNNVIVSNFTRNHKLAQYLSECKPHSVGISTNISNLRKIFDASKYDENYTEELLAYVSDLFSRNVKLYAYPYLERKTGEIVTTSNMKVSENAKPLFEFLVMNKFISDIEDFSAEEVKTV